MFRLNANKSEGMLKLPNGEVYDGEFKDDKKEGKGVLNCVDILITVNSRMIKEMEMGLKLFQMDMKAGLKMIN